jgi:hypothetical protein
MSTSPSAMPRFIICGGYPLSVSVTLSRFSSLSMIYLLEQMR